MNIFLRGSKNSVYTYISDQIHHRTGYIRMAIECETTFIGRNFFRLSFLHSHFVATRVYLKIDFFLPHQRNNTNITKTTTLKRKLGEIRGPLKPPTLGRLRHLAERSAVFAVAVGCRPLPRCSHCGCPAECYDRCHCLSPNRLSKFFSAVGDCSS